MFDRDIEYSNDKNSYSPFDSDKIYIYFNAFNYETKKYKVELNYQSTKQEIIPYDNKESISL